ncbi:MAG: hypothetical protein HOE48_10065 [Candidatus Latescibacteria bacterium]|jgi:hypothetical protein|nr:hypothetical protein [Candidatus Latescibacterota bacterium]MBT4138252.1 hypothetical protein [Candidatus Latescibacterota bacterium]MBT5829906.1 hypothetical protein [Candidatus Latescibacterota bacterium]
MADLGTSENYLRTMYVNPSSNNARAIFEQGNWQFEPHPALANFVWMRHKYQQMFHHLRQGQLLNHIPCESAICDKGHLTRHLQVFDSISSEDHISLSDFYPETYCLYRKDHYQAFLKQVPTKDSPDNLWILKPTNESRGVGVRVIWELNKLKEKLLYPQKNVTGLDVDLSSRYVIQRYIQNPLLLEGHKSEIRLYWLIACLDPLLVLLYKEGTTRRNASPFQLGEFDNPLVHITNIYQQKKHHPDADSLTLKWNFAQLQSYLTDELQLAAPHYIQTRLKPQWKKMLSFVVSSTKKTLMRRPNNGHFWGLYGADVILDAQLRPWLTEVQIGPGLSHDDAVKKGVIPNVVSEAAEIVLEVQARKRKGASLRCLDAMDGFEWVINEAV